MCPRTHVRAYVPAYVHADVRRYALLRREFVCARSIPHVCGYARTYARAPSRTCVRINVRTYTHADAFVRSSLRVRKQCAPDKQKVRSPLRPPPCRPSKARAHSGTCPRVPVRTCARGPPCVHARDGYARTLRPRPRVQPTEAPPSPPARSAIRPRRHVRQGCAFLRGQGLQHVLRHTGHQGAVSRTSATRLRLASAGPEVAADDQGNLPAKCASSNTFAYTRIRACARACVWA